MNHPISIGNRKNSISHLAACMIFTGAILCGAVFSAHAQQPAPSHAAPTSAPPLAKFEVVSIKPSEDRFLRLAQEGKNPVRVDDAQATLTGIDLSTLVQMAFQMPKYRVVLPHGVSGAHFNIAGKLPEGSTAVRFPEMVQSMLIDRFKMTFHREQRVLPVYYLSVGKGAPRLKPSTTTDPDQRGCSVTGINYHCQGVTMDQIAGELTKGYYLASAAQEQNLPAAAALAQQWPDKPVIDRTGLDGSYDFAVDFGKSKSTNGDATDASDEPISAFSAAKAIGLVLKPGDEPLEFLVVDHIETAPSDN